MQTPTTTRYHADAGAWSRRLLVACVATVVVFGTGVTGRPDGAGWGVFYDAVLFNAVSLLAAATCLVAARRVRAERAAWWSMALYLLLSATGNLWYTVLVAPLDAEPYPSAADVLYLGAYLPLYASLVFLIRSRVTRFHPSMWLDGLIGALGAAAIAVSALLAPALELTDGTTAAVLTSLAYPVVDVLLLALLAGAGAMLGIRRDPALLLAGLGIVANLVGDTVYLDLVTQGLYTEGGPLDLTWLAGGVAFAAAAHRASAGRRTPAPSPGTGRVGWRVLVVPTACNAASLGVLVAGWGSSISDVAAWCAATCVLAALVRTAITFREVRSFHEVRAQALTDELTGLPNRRALLERAQRMVATAAAQRPAALLLLDLDGFKEVNDTLGHHAGDQLLAQVGPRVRSVLTDDQLLARLGGDEFAVLLPDTDLDGAQECAERVRAALLEPFAVQAIRLHVGVSIGISSTPVPAATVQELLRCADIAMYAAKSGRLGTSVYVAEPVGDRLRTMEELRVALVEDQLEVHLQPQVALPGRQVVGTEALVRWRHPTRGLLMPGDLLPAAEQAGLLHPLANAVLDLALGATARWWPALRVPVSVNLSAADVTDLELPAKVCAALARHGLPAEALTLELVEDTLMADPARGQDVLGRLRALGVRTSIDDYGTGYSSLAYLRHLPADELKLDRSLITGVHDDPRTAAIVQHTVALAHDLGLSLVAEGVEEEAEIEVLTRLGCDVVQGYGIARPMPVPDFLAWLAGHAAGREDAPASSAGAHATTG